MAQTFFYSPKAFSRSMIRKMRALVFYTAFAEPEAVIVAYRSDRTVKKPAHVQNLD